MDVASPPPLLGSESKQQVSPETLGPQPLQAPLLASAYTLPAAAHASPGSASALALAQAQPQRRLNSQAPAWTPSAKPATVAMSSASSFFARHVSVVVSSAAAALAQRMQMGVVQAIDGLSGWSICVALPLSDISTHHGQVLMLASQALLQAARASRTVHLIGSLSKAAFTTTPLGCSAALGSVEDEEKLCWDAVAHGYCHRGRTCRWQHPSETTTVNIMVKIAHSS